MPRLDEETRESQRERILDGARRAFALKGSATTMADVAAAAEVSQGLPYRYFASKEEIFRSLLERSLRSAPAMTDRALHGPGTPGERLAALITELLLSRREALEFHGLFLEVRDDEATPADLRKLIRERASAFLDLVRQLIVQAQASGEAASGDPDQLVMAVTACLDGLTRMAIRSPRMREHFPDATILLRMLGLERRA